MKTAVAQIITTPRRGSKRVALLALVGCLLIWFCRRPEQLFHPYLWDEESLVIRRFLDHGWLGALRPVQGYEILPATFLLPLAAAISFAHVTVLAFWMATAVFALTVWMLVAPDSRWGSQSTRVLMAFAMALCPANPETFGVLLYSLWWATLWPVIILGWKQDIWWARVPLLVIGGLSSPAGAVMAVPFAVSCWFSRRRADVVATGILVVGSSVQVASLLMSERRGALALYLPSILAQAERAVGLFVIWWTAPADLDWRIVSMVGLAVLVALAGAAAYAMGRRQAVEPLLLLVALTLFTGMSAVPAPLATNPYNAGPRYYFLPFVLASWLLVHLWREGELPSPIPVVAGVLVATSMLGIVTTFFRSPASSTGKLDWGQEIGTCAASKAPAVNVPVYYDGSETNLWWMSMKPDECRRLSQRL